MLSHATLRFGLCLAILGASLGASHAQTSAGATATAPQGEQARLLNGFTGIWYQIRDDAANVVKYGGGMSTYPQQVAPMAIYVPSQQKTFFATMIDEGDGEITHAMSWFDHRTGEVARPRAWVRKRTGDAHDAPAIAFDRQGRIIMFSNTHGELREAYIHRSIKPYDIDRFESLVDIDRAEDFAAFGSTDRGQRLLRFSYGQPWALADGRLLFLHTRYSRDNPQSGGERDLYWTMSENGDHWSKPDPLARIARGQYAVSWPKPGRQGVGVAFDYHPDGKPGAALDWRTDLFYLETRDGRTWTNAAGTPLVEKGRWLTKPENPARVYDAPDGERVYIKSVAYTADAAPVILFLTSGDNLPSARPRRLRTARWTGKQWTIRDVTTTDHNYDHGFLSIDGAAWSIVGPFLPGPQANATGGRIGEWRSTDQGRSWKLARRYVHRGDRNDTYVRNPLNADARFWSFWADGDGLESSGVDLFFADRAGTRFRLPRSFPQGAMTVKPEPVR